VIFLFLGFGLNVKRYHHGKGYGIYERRIPAAKGCQAITIVKCLKNGDTTKNYILKK